MKESKTILLPFLVGLLVAVMLYTTIHWWGFLVLFPWIGFSLSVGAFLRFKLTGKNRLIGRKISILMILPSLLFFIPIVNNENFQLEGVVLIVLVGFLDKGFIHYAIAKIFGPLLWRRGFCGHACWTAAVLDWLPIRQKGNTIPRSYRNYRFILLAVSLMIPMLLIFVFEFNPWTQFINRNEMKLMFISNGIYYAIAIPLAFILSDKRAFCKYVCPVSLVMILPSKIGVLKIKPNLENDCIECNKCNTICPMGVNIMDCMKRNVAISDSECVLCGDCRIVCPKNKIA